LIAFCPHFDRCSDGFFSDSAQNKVLAVLDFGNLGEKVGNIELNTDLSEKEVHKTPPSEFFMFPICGDPREQDPWALDSSQSPIIA